MGTPTNLKGCTILRTIITSSLLFEGLYKVTTHCILEIIIIHRGRGLWMIVFSHFKGHLFDLFKKGNPSLLWTSFFVDRRPLLPSRLGFIWAFLVHAIRDQWMHALCLHQRSHPFVNMFNRGDGLRMQRRMRWSSSAINLYRFGVCYNAVVELQWNSKRIHTQKRTYLEAVNYMRIGQPGSNCALSSMIV